MPLGSSFILLLASLCRSLRALGEVPARAPARFLMRCFHAAKHRASYLLFSVICVRDVMLLALENRACQGVGPVLYYARSDETSGEGHESGAGGSYPQLLILLWISCASLHPPSLGTHILQVIARA